MAPREAAAMFGVRTAALARWARIGRLPALLTLGGHRRYRPSDLRRLLDLENTSPAQSQLERDAVRMYQEGWSIRQVADRFGMTYGAMRRILSEHTTLRTRSGTEVPHRRQSSHERGPPQRPRARSYGLMVGTCWRTSLAHPYVGQVRNRWHPERTAGRRHRTEPALRAQESLAQTDVLIAGLFSAKCKDHGQLMDALAAEVTSRGGRVVGRFVQRRGISGGKKGNAPGGRVNMDRPYSARTLMSTGKVEEIAAACATTGAGAVVFFNELTDRQRTALTEVFGCPTLSRSDLPHVRESPTASPPGAHRRTALG